MNDRDRHKDQEHGSPLLKGLPKNDPFVVEPGFFERFPHEVQALAVRRAPKHVLPAVWRRIAVALPVATLVFGAIWWWQHDASVDAPRMARTVEVTPLTNEEIDDLDDPDLLAIAEEIAPATADAAPLGQVDLTLNENELVAYFEYENADLNELIAQQ